MSLSKTLLPSLEIGLNAMSGLLDKAEAYAAAKKCDHSVLLNWRLAPNMFPFKRQVQIVTDQAKNGSARLAGVTPPRFEDNETTIAELKDRLAKTIAFVKSVDAKAIDGAGARDIEFPLGPVKKGHMKGADYLHHFVLPNFYFHLTTAYDILRGVGVEIGKDDFLGPIPMKVT